jgi:hypothetical protein
MTSCLINVAQGQLYFYLSGSGGGGGGGITTIGSKKEEATGGWRIFYNYIICARQISIG